MRTLGLVLLGVIISFSIGSADLTIKFEAENTVSTPLPQKIQGTYSIKGENSRIETLSSMIIQLPQLQDISFENKSVTITLLDSGKVWLFLPDKEYMELDALALNSPDTSYILNEYTWIFDVVPIEKTNKIKKLICNGQIGKAVGVSKDDPADTVFVTFEQWQSDDTLYGPEFSSYQDRYAEVTGRNRMWAQKHLANNLQSGFSAIFEKLSDMMNSRNCIPLKLSFTVDRTVKYEPVSTAVTGSGRRVQMSRRGKGIRPSDGGNWELVRFTSEVTGLQRKSIKDSQFELPAGYKRKAEDTE